MVGSNQSISDANVVLNTIMADALSDFCSKLEKKTDIEAAARRLIKDTFKKHSRIIFNGNGYTDEWVAEAASRGLCNFCTTADAVIHMSAPKNIRLYTKHKVFTEKEIRSRQEIMLEEYVNVVKIEMLTMLDMAHKEILPACLSYAKELSELALSKKNIGMEIGKAESELISKVSELTDALLPACDELELIYKNINGSAEERAFLIKDRALPAMEKLRNIADRLELIVSNKYWPFPTYGDILFYH